MMVDMLRIMESKVEAKRMINSKLREERAELEEQVMQVNALCKEANLELNVTSVTVAKMMEMIYLEIKVANLKEDRYSGVSQVVMNP